MCTAGDVGANDLAIVIPLLPLLKSVFIQENFIGDKVLVLLNKKFFL